MSFIWPLMLLSLLFVPLLIVLYLRQLERRRAVVAELGSMGVFQNSSGRKPGIRRHAPPLFFLFGLTFLLFGLARPEMMVSLPRIEGTVILAFDVSNSMKADDLQPTRLDAAKAAASAFVENQPMTIKIGIVAFSNGGLVVQQPTNDQGAVLSAIARLSPQGGTSIGHGIFTSLNALAGEAITIDETALEGDLPVLQIDDPLSAVVVMLTDGENTGPLDPLEIAQLAAEAGVRIYPVGIGSPQGSVVQIDGFDILTQLNEGTLQEIANLTNGQYYHAADEDKLQEIYENIDLRLTISGEKNEVTSVFAGISLLCLIIGGALSLFWFGRLP